MLRSVNELKGQVIHAIDGELGNVGQFLFDDESWTIRYLVVETGKLLGRKVLISPLSIDPRQNSDNLHLSLTKAQIQNSPDIDTDKPVSRQRETEYFNYFGYPYYWSEPGLLGGTRYPIRHQTTNHDEADTRTSRETGAAVAAKAQPVKKEDPHLRSTTEVIGYYIEASDGDIGHVEDFLIDDESWAIRYMIVDTVNWWPGKKVVVAPQWIRDVSWTESKVFVDLPRERIKNAPEYDPALTIDRGYEEKLYDYHQKQKYWNEPLI